MVNALPMEPFPHPPQVVTVDVVLFLSFLLITSSTHIYANGPEVVILKNKNLRLPISSREVAWRRAWTLAYFMLSEFHKSLIQAGTKLGYAY